MRPGPFNVLQVILSLADRETDTMIWLYCIALSPPISLAIAFAIGKLVGHPYEGESDSAWERMNGDTTVRVIDVQPLRRAIGE